MKTHQLMHRDRTWVNSRIQTHCDVLDELECELFLLDRGVLGAAVKVDLPVVRLLLLYGLARDMHHPVTNVLHKMDRHHVTGSK